MSELAVTGQAITDDMPLFRSVAVEYTGGGDGRTLLATFVPYGQTARVVERRGDRVERYQERFLPGAFRKQLRAAHRVKAFVNYRHGQGIGDQIGAVRSVEETATELRGEIGIFKTPNGDTALEMFREGLDRVSVEFLSLSHRIVDGIVERLDARLLGVALVPQGMYEGAMVTGRRELLVAGEDYDALPALNPETAAKLAAFGVRV